MEDGIAMSKAKGWFLMLYDVKKIEFMEWLWKSEPHKMTYSKMSEPERRFHNPNAKRPTHQDE